MVKASNNEYPSVLFDEQGSDPSAPASTLWRAYFKSDGAYFIDDAGVVAGPTHNALKSFTPTLTAVTTDPTLGSGSSIQGWYIQSGMMLTVSVRIIWGTSGTNAGSGNYIVGNLPAGASGYAAYARVGGGDAQMNGTYYTVSALWNNTARDAVLMVASDGNVVDHDSPGAWGANEELNLALHYAAA